MVVIYPGIAGSYCSGESFPVIITFNSDNFTNNGFGKSHGHFRLHQENSQGAGGVKDVSIYVVPLLQSDESVPQLH